MVKLIEKLRGFQKNKFVVALFWLAAIATLFFLSFQYTRLAHFPTGDDPAVHIGYIEHMTFNQIWSTTNYPLPLAIFKFLHNVINIPIARLFTILISSFFFFSTICFFFFARKITSSALVAFISAAVFATGAMVADGLRMGLLAESFGWGMLLLALLALVSQNIPLILTTALLLVFSHPFSLTIYVLVAIIYLTILFFSRERKERNFALITVGIFVAVLLLGLFFEKHLVEKFINFANPERIGWGERRLWEILTVDDMRRILPAFFALIGLAVAAKDWQKPGIKISYILLFVGLFMSMNQIFGIRFLVFRFFPYLEMGVAIFAGIGLFKFIELVGLKKYRTLSVLILSFLVLIPQYIGNGVATYAQVHDVAMNDSATAGDQVAFKWINDNLPSGATINATHKRAIWINALTKFTALEDAKPFDKAITDTLYSVGGSYSYQYIYYAEVDAIPDAIVQNFSLVYDSGGVKIYKNEN